MSEFYELQPNSAFEGQSSVKPQSNLPWSKAIVGKGITSPRQKNSTYLKDKKLRSKLSKSVKSWRLTYLRLLRRGGKPQILARGLAAGVFAGCFPFLGFQTFIGVIIASFIGGNKFAAAAGTWISNPLTYAPIFFFNFKVGQFLLASQDLDFDQSSFQSWASLKELGAEFASTFLLGSLVVGAVLACLTYLISLKAIDRYQKSRKLRKKSLRQDKFKSGWFL